MKRREFLKGTTGLMAAGIYGRVAYGQAAASERVRLAVMGCHGRGRGFSLMKTLARVSGAEVAVVCDVDARAREQAAAQVEKIAGNKPAQVKDIRRVLEDKSIDGVLCAAPDHWHAPAALMTMQAGKSIYVEKPCSYNPGEGEMLVKAADKYNAIFQMGNQRRASNVYQAVIKEIHGGLIGEQRFARCWYATRRGTIGNGKAVSVPEWLDWDLWQGPAPRKDYKDNIVHYHWHWFKHWGTGEFGNNAPHFLDIARWALQVRYPTRVTGAGAKLYNPSDDWEWFDTQTASIEFPDNRFINWECLSSLKVRPYENLGTGCMVYGSKGAVLFRPNDTCALFDNEGKIAKEWNSKNLATDAMDRANPAGGLDTLHLTDWARCIKERDVKTRTPADEAHATILLCHLANIAALAGETIKLDAATGQLAKGSPGGEYWNREYAKGWEPKV